MRRRTDWAGVVGQARSSPGVWRLHSTLVHADEHLVKHAQRRVLVLQSTNEGHFEFSRRNRGINDLGITVFDLFVRWVPRKESHREHHQEDHAADRAGDA